MTNVTESLEQITADFVVLFEDAIAETGVSLRAGVVELAAFAAERSAYLATLVDDPGFNMALRAERDAVVLHAGITAVQQADQADERFVGLIQGGLALAARLLSIA